MKNISSEDTEVQANHLEKEVKQLLLILLALMTTLTTTLL
jgi:hypothetical protein